MTDPLRGTSLTVVPAGPVSDRTRVEVRVGLQNSTTVPETWTVDFFLDRLEADRRIGGEAVTISPAGVALARCWWDTSGQAGHHRLLYRATQGDLLEEGSWPIEVIASDTPGLPFFQGVWSDGLSIQQVTQGLTPEATDRYLRASVDALAELGVTMILFTYVEWYGTWLYPSTIEFFDRDIQRISRAAPATFDCIEPLLSQADRRGMHVFLGLGRGGDLWLLWRFSDPDWDERNAFAIDLGKQVAHELWQRYGHHPSLYGWYLTHEVKEFEKGSAYYNPIADICHRLSPDKAVLIAPAGAPVITPELLRASSVDILAYQDAVGSGWMEPGVNTWDQNRRIAVLDEYYEHYRRQHEGTDKHIWSDLEIWEMDGSQGYSGSYPPTFERVRRQIEIERRYVPVLTAYTFHGLMHDPAWGGQSDERAVKLYRDYRAYVEALRRS